MDSYNNEFGYEIFNKVNYVQAKLEKIRHTKQNEDGSSERSYIEIMKHDPQTGEDRLYCMQYDVLVIACGASYSCAENCVDKFWRDEFDQSRTRKQRSKQFMALRKKLRAVKKLLIAGAGPVGLQTAGWIKEMYPDIHVSICMRGKELLGQVKCGSRAKKPLEKLLNNLNIDIITQKKVEDIE